MKGYTFYVECNSPKDKRQNKNNGNCIAINNKDSFILNGELCYNGLSAVQNIVADSPHLCWSNISQGYLRSNCKRVPMGVAEAIHPNLFKHL
jgi:hypothetical protein